MLWRARLGTVARPQPAPVHPASQPMTYLLGRAQPIAVDTRRILQPLPYAHVAFCALRERAQVEQRGKLAHALLYGWGVGAKLAHDKHVIVQQLVHQRG